MLFMSWGLARVSVRWKSNQNRLTSDSPPCSSWLVFEQPYESRQKCSHCLAARCLANSQTALEFSLETALFLWHLPDRTQKKCIYYVFLWQKEPWNWWFNSNVALWPVLRDLVCCPHQNHKMLRKSSGYFLECSILFEIDSCWTSTDSNFLRLR